MKMEKPEKTQKGNRYQLTKAQHVFPHKNIDRFKNLNGTVELADGSRNIIRRAAPNDLAFCAARAWDQRAERGYMKSIENAFQEIVEIALKSNDHRFSNAELFSISNFYALWHFRSRMRELKQQFYYANGVTGNDFPLETFEMMESQYTTAVRPDGGYPARHINSMQIQILTARFATEELKDAAWGIVIAEDGQYLVPDVPNHGIIPVTPEIALVKNCANGIITHQNLADVNAAMAAKSHVYVFANSLRECPGTKSIFEFCTTRQADRRKK